MTSSPMDFTIPILPEGVGEVVSVAGDRSALTPRLTRQWESRPCQRRRMSEAVDILAFSTPVMGESMLCRFDGGAGVAAEEGGVGAMGGTVSGRREYSLSFPGSTSTALLLLASRSESDLSGATTGLAALCNLSAASLGDSTFCAPPALLNQYSPPTVHSLS